MFIKLIYYIASVLSIVFFVISVQFKEKKNILLVQTIASFCYMTTYFIIEAYSGCITEIIEQCKNILFYFYEKNNKQIPFILLILFILGLILVAVFTYDGFNTLLPLIINLAYFISSYLKDPKHIRIVMIICAIIWICYNFTVGAYIIIIGNIFEIVSAIISLVRFQNESKV